MSDGECALVAAVADEGPMNLTRWKANAECYEGRAEYAEFTDDAEIDNGFGKYVMDQSVPVETSFFDIS